MSKHHRRSALGLAAAAAVALCTLSSLPANAASTSPNNVHAGKHVLLISVDGMH